MRATTLMKHILEPHQDKKIYIRVNSKNYELGKAFVTDDVMGENGELKEHGRVILCAGEPIMEKPSESV